MKPHSKTGIPLLAMSLVLSGIAPAALAAGREVKCESHSMKHEYCSTGKHGAVKLLDHSGFWPCKENETWGVETEGIWVDRGCKGRFWVDEAGSDRHSGRDAAIAAAVGIGLLAALAASHAKKDEAPANSAAAGIPNWLIGSFHGYNPRQREESAITVGASGRISIRVRNQEKVGSWVADNQIQWADGSRSTVTRTESGFRLSPAGDTSNFADYYRD